MEGSAPGREMVIVKEQSVRSGYAKSVTAPAPSPRALPFPEIHPRLTLANQRRTASSSADIRSGLSGVGFLNER